MYLEGAKIEGFKYGGVSPLDYSGLKAWYKASDGNEFLKGNLINKWRDLSGNGNHLMPQSGGTSAGELVNTVDGLAVTRLGASNALVSSNPALQQLVSDGNSNSSMLIVMRTANTTASLSNFIRGVPNGSTNTIVFDISQPASLPRIRIIILDNTGTKISIITDAPYFLPNQSAVHTIVNYGYGSSVPTPFQYRFNNDLKTSVNYLGVPVYVPTSNFGILPNPLLYLFKVIIYDNTGKAHKFFDGSGFPAYKAGTTDLRPEFNTDANKGWGDFHINTENPEFNQFFVQKVKIEDTIKRTQGNYATLDSIKILDNNWGKFLMLFMRWMPEHINQRFGTRSVDILFYQDQDILL